MVSKMKNFLKFKTGENKHDMRKFGEEFYLREAKLWRPFRWFGILSTLTAMALMVAAILNEDWIHSTSKSYGLQILSTVTTEKCLSKMN